MVATLVRIQRIEILDDMDGEPIDPDDFNRVEFEVKLPGRRPVRYCLDLRSANVARFETGIAEYVGMATRVPAGDTTAGTSTRTQARRRNQAIRRWAQENGYEVSTRGRLSADLIEAFEAAVS
ncbi:histone-like nucleoid-structuring protein Lsr2 [Gordonia mangrovi]|uniref:histone-like nucleoid-structuring protein Lsr2 n=1 Tax=Gordonia mangrovi TaxID=2665643 RepID=UPI00136DF56D|nr:Lsr2 family protein [Gordonia mangrovi]UVF80080.1 Lsr2 family protein [Gordonia mangrovi]